MLYADTYRPDDLPAADVAAWRTLCARPEYTSPLLGPDFARAVGDVRADVRVSVWRRPNGDGTGRPVAFLAYHRRPGDLARPIGAPLSDYHSLVAAEAVDPAEALACAGLSAFRFTGLLDASQAFAGTVASEREAFLIELSDGADSYLEALRALSPKRFKNYRRLDHKLEREQGELTVVAPDHDPAAFEQLLAWKRAQLVRTGKHNFLAPAWTRRLMQELFERREGPLQGLAFNLYAGGRLVAGHFGVRVGEVYHPWIASTDPELAAWSPGQVFLLRAIGAMPAAGLTTYDLGPGHEHYKRPFSLSTRTIGEGLMAAAGPQGRHAQAAEQAWILAGARRGGLVGRLRRRLDVIATTELSLIGRTRGFMGALAASTRRPGGTAEAL
jgi:CelD/BcsL family acetyltransferase involved in cellulose biosynthesis